jgi:Holliday junction resolvase-like predicted endonuclease
MARLSPRKQGDLGEFSAVQWLGKQGFDVWIPLGHGPNCDLIADDGETLLRAQVKTTTFELKNRWAVAICTRGGNRSWNGIVKRFSAARCDRLFVLVGDGRRWFIPAQAVQAGTRLLLGGPKYADYEIDRDRPLLPTTVADR